MHTPKLVQINKGGLGKPSPYPKDRTNWWDVKGPLALKGAVTAGDWGIVVALRQHDPAGRYPSTAVRRSSSRRRAPFVCFADISPARRGNHLPLGEGGYRTTPNRRSGGFEANGASGMEETKIPPRSSDSGAGMSGGLGRNDKSVFASFCRFGQKATPATAAGGGYREQGVGAVVGDWQGGLSAADRAGHHKSTVPVRHKQKMRCVQGICFQKRTPRCVYIGGQLFFYQKPRDFKSCNRVT